MNGLEVFYSFPAEHEQWGGEVIHREVNSILLPVALSFPPPAEGETETQHPLLKHQIKVSPEMHLKSDPKLLKMTIFTEFSEVSDFNSVFTFF